MHLIVQIPCYNEAETLPRTLADIPREIRGISRVEVLVVDDGSDDGTAEIAHRHGADHVVRHGRNKGLARSFETGIDACLKRGADIIVNTDGDNQYSGADIAALVQPIVEGRAEIVIGNRGTASNPHFSSVKKLLQRCGSLLVRVLSGLDVPDAVSGFRAVSRDAAFRINIVSRFSYTIEMLIQAGRKQMAVASVPVRTNAATRPSRLFRSTPGFILRSVETMLRIFVMYQPLRAYVLLGSVLVVIGAAPILRFLWSYIRDGGAGHVQSLVIGGVLLILGFLAFVIGVIADLIGFNRQLAEITLEKVRRLDCRSTERPPDAACRE